MSKIFRTGLGGTRHGHLYTIEDVRVVNAMQVRCCKSSSGVCHCKSESGIASYTAKELNEAWKGVLK